MYITVENTVGTSSERNCCEDPTDFFATSAHIVPIRTSIWCFRFKDSPAPQKTLPLTGYGGQVMKKIDGVHNERAHIDIQNILCSNFIAFQMFLFEKPLKQFWSNKLLIKTFAVYSSLLFTKLGRTCFPDVYVK